MFDEKHDEASVCFLREFDKSLLRWKQRRDEHHTFFINSKFPGARDMLEFGAAGASR